MAAAGATVQSSSDQSVIQQAARPKERQDHECCCGELQLTFCLYSWFNACRKPEVQTKVKDPKTSLPVLLVVAGAVTALLWWRRRGASGSRGGKGDSSTSRSPFAFPGKKVR